MNLSALTKKDVPVTILEQFGYSKRESLTASVNYDTSANYIRKGLFFYFVLVKLIWFKWFRRMVLELSSMVTSLKVAIKHLLT